MPETKEQRAIRIIEEETEAITKACQDIFDSLAYLLLAKQVIIGYAEQSNTIKE